MPDFFPQTESLIVKARTVRGIPPTERMVSHPNIGSLLRERAGEQTGKVWLIDYPETARSARVACTYGEFYERVARTANYLLSQGVGRGDRIATIAYNHTDTVVQYFATFL